MYPELFDVQGPPILTDDDNELLTSWKRDLQSRGIPIPPKKPEVDDFLALLRALPGESSTILDLRRKHPDLFDVEGWPNHFNPLYQLSNDLLDLLFTERALARMAYQEAIGKPEELLKGVYPHDREGFITDLVEYYTQYGLANGEHEARQLIRDFTGQAMRQALSSPPQNKW